jgi:hypothetical protein
MTKPCYLAGAVVLLVLAGPARADDWRKVLAKELPVLGQRNWIVVADAAFPAQTSAGLVTVATGADHLEVLRTVFEALDKSKHVRAVVCTNSELPFVAEKHAKGIAAYRQDLKQLLRGREVYTLDAHEQLLDRLATAGAKYRVLVFKTNLTLPYTSVFLMLDCAYWSDAAEQQLREAIQAAKE